MSHSSIIPRFRPPSQCLVNRLSNEILELIFVSSVPPSLSEPVPGSGAHFVHYMNRAGVLDYPTLLALVCNRWRAVAQGSQTLYSFLFVDAEEEGDLEFKRDSAYYAAYLARSGTRPLTLSIRGLQDTCINLLGAAPFRDHLRRLKWACIDMYVPELQDMHEYEDPNGYDVFPLFPRVETPALETVHVDLGEDQGMASFGGTYHLFRRLKQAVEVDKYKGDTGGKDGSRESNAGEDNASADDSSEILRHAPRLQSFSMDRFDFDGLWTPLSLKKAGLDYATLTCLRLSYVQLRAADWLEFLAKLPLLEVFSCRLLDCENEEEDSAHSSGGMDRSRDGSVQSSGKDEQARCQEDRPGPLTLPYLTELSLFSDLVDNILCTYPANAQTGTGKFLAGLVLPSLKAFAFKTNSFWSDYASDSDSDDEDHSISADYKTDIADDRHTVAEDEEVAAEMTYDKFLLPALRGLIQRSGCEVQALTFDVPHMDLRDLVRVLKILPELRALHLDLNMVACEGDLLERLARRSAAGSLDLVPKLTHLVLDNYERDLYHPQYTIPLRNVLRLVGERWPVGWTDWQVATVRAVVKEDVEELKAECDGVDGDDEDIANEDAMTGDEDAGGEEQVADDEEASDDRVIDGEEDSNDEEGSNDREELDGDEGSDGEEGSDVEETSGEEEEVSNEEEVPVDAEEAGNQSSLVELIEDLHSLRARGDIDLIVGWSTAELYC
ncbi:hypothetical protein EV121DRAFT_296384 [Schizophyllum commune]